MVFRRARRSRLVPAVVVLAIVGGVLLAPAATAQQAERSQLQDAKDRLARLADQIQAAESEAEDAESELANAEMRLEQVEAIVNEVASQVEAQREAVSEAHDRLRAVEAEAAEVADALVERITRLFKQGPELGFEILFVAEASDDALARATMLTHVSQADQIDLQALEAAERRVAAERERLLGEQELLEQLLEEQQELLEQVERLRDSRALAAAAARQQVDDLHAERDDLEDESRRLESLIRQKQEQERRRAAAAREQPAAAGREQAAASSGAPAAAVSGSSASGFAWPLCARVSSEYGPRWGRMHRGIDLAASTGTPVGASKSGTVIFAGWQGGYGQLVLVDHGDGVVTAYAHLSRIDVRSGTAVSQGQTLGLVGSTGNSTGPHLHLETRVNGAAVNPRQYLSGRPC